MRAVVIDAYGGTDQLELRDLPTPVPGPGQVRIQTQAASVNPVDYKMRSGELKQFYPVSFPGVLGFDVAGIVDAVGPDVVHLRAGDEVFCRLPTNRGGGYAEYVVTDADIVARMPMSLGFEEAAGMPLAALTALQALRDLAALRTGQRVLVNGASGGVGTYAVQIAKAMGCDVTAVCSGISMQMVASLGADRCIDYRAEDFVASGQTFDVVFDAIGNRSFPECRPVMAQGGAYVSTVFSLPLVGWRVWTRATRWLGGPTAHWVQVEPSRSDLEQLALWADVGSLRTLVDSVFPLSDVAGAHERSASGRAKGKIIVKVVSDRPELIVAPVEAVAK
jgi:NADPH:quinone reductase-like Zn-dependent oxidoreductase